MRNTSKYAEGKLSWSFWYIVFVYTYHTVFLTEHFPDEECKTPPNFFLCANINMYNSSRPHSPCLLVTPLEAGI